MKKYIAITVFALVIALLSVFVRNADFLDTTSDAEQSAEAFNQIG